MELKYQSTMLLPASYAVLSEEEMTYIDGGAFNITPETVATIAVSVAINALFALGKGAFNQAVTIVDGGLSDGMSLAGIGEHFWNSLNGWSKVATVGLGALGGFYLYTQIRSIVGSLKNLYDSVVNPMPSMPAPNTSADAAAAA